MCTPGEVPLHTAIRHTSDTGTPIVASQPDSSQVIHHKHYYCQTILFLSGRSVQNGGKEDTRQTAHKGTLMITVLCAIFIMYSLNIIMQHLRLYAQFRISEEKDRLLQYYVILSMSVPFCFLALMKSSMAFCPAYLF